MLRTILLAFSLLAISSPGFAERQFDQEIGVRLETQWHIGKTHQTQSRWQHSFAIAKTPELFRFIRPIYGIDTGFNEVQPANELVSVLYERRSPFVFEYQLGAFGDSKTMLFGVPVAQQVSPVNSASGKEASWVANPWVWVGAVAVGAAAASGGGGGSSSGDDSSGGTTLVGGDECNGVSGSPTEPEVGSGCQVAGNDPSVQ